jgi:hypothetical protein
MNSVEEEMEGRMETGEGGGGVDGGEGVKELLLARILY